MVLTASVRGLCAKTRATGGRGNKTGEQDAGHAAEPMRKRRAIFLAIHGSESTSISALSVQEEQKEAARVVMALLDCALSCEVVVEE